jgi:thioredoxin 1
MQNKKVVELHDDQFDASIAQGVTLVDFWAPWCAPCRMQGPILEEVAESVDAPVKIAKLNVDDAGAIAERFDVQSIPTLILFKNGDEVRRFVGVQHREILIDAIRAAV